MTISEMEDARDAAPEEVEDDDDLDFDVDGATNLLNDCRDMLELLATLDEKSNILTRNKRLGLTGLRQELDDFLGYT